jgi:protein-S-isoprenylcysteine O-methyltransferase
MNLQNLLWLVVVSFPASEIVLAYLKRASRSGATARDRGSMQLMWAVITAAVFAAVFLTNYRRAAIRLPAPALESAALVLLGGGLALRWAAILTLGRFFTPDVAVHQGHRLVASGPYRYLRHPSYTGLLAAFLGLGLFFGNWLSLAALMIPITLAVLHRVRIEEAVLLEALGPDYAEYRARTKRLIPGLL